MSATPEGYVRAPYGYCPICGQPGRERERRPNGEDRCVLGHDYPSRDALPVEPKQDTDQP